MQYTIQITLMILATPITLTIHRIEQLLNQELEQLFLKPTLVNPRSIGFISEIASSCMTQTDHVHNHNTHTYMYISSYLVAGQDGFNHVHFLVMMISENPRLRCVCHLEVLVSSENVDGVM